MQNPHHRKQKSHEKQKPIIIIGAGAAGIGMGITLKHLNVPFLIIDQEEVGSSFTRWSPETRFISPSFTGNAFGYVDLNAISPDTSPAFTLKSEHPTGQEYASYLQGLAKHFELPVVNNLRVSSIRYEPEYREPFTINTSEGEIISQYVIWAAGEYQYPNTEGFVGSELCIHYADVRSWESTIEDEDDTVYVIGGYESGIDAAYQLVKLGKKVVLFDGDDQINKHGSDSSYTLSPFTRDRLREVEESLTIINSPIKKIEHVVSSYVLNDDNGKSYKASTVPINCTGFSSSLSLVKELFDFDNNNVVLNNNDESTLCPNLFLSGPQVRHGEAIFCFIYKYRQRFGIIGECISLRSGGDIDAREQLIKYYKKTNFFLDDLSCCEDECVC